MTARERARDYEWRYSAEDASGSVVTGAIAAADLSEARKALADHGLAPIRLTKASPFQFPRLRGTGADSLTLEAVAELSQHLSDLLSAGIPLASALNIVSEQATSENERRFLTGLLNEIRLGRSLTEALARVSPKAPPLFGALVEAGEALGSLSRQVERLAHHYGEALKTRRELIGHLVYPAALIVLIGLTLIFLSFLVLPQFDMIFQSAGAKPPAETRMVLAAAAAIRQFWWLGPAPALLAYVAAPLLARRYSGMIGRAMLSTPYIGRILLYAESGRYLRTLATMLEGGAPLARAMPLARQTLTFNALRERYEDAENAVRTGDKLAPALGRLTQTPADLVSIVEIGEETGELARLAGKAAARAESICARRVRRAMTLLSPILTALIGLLTAGVIAAVMSGVLSLNEAVL